MFVTVLPGVVVGGAAAVAVAVVDVIAICYCFRRYLFFSCLNAYYLYAEKASQLIRLHTMTVSISSQQQHVATVVGDDVGVLLCCCYRQQQQVVHETVGECQSFYYSYSQLVLVTVTT